MRLQGSGRNNSMKPATLRSQTNPVKVMNRGCWKTRAVSFQGLTALFIAMALLLPGCGRKAPPAPPLREIPPAVTDLSWEISKQTLTLSWSVPQVKNSIRLAGFKIYRAQKRLSDADCPDCPGRFKPVADILIENPMEQDQGPERKIYTEALEAGSRYEYKVVGYTENGVSSLDSNIVEFDYQIREKKDRSEDSQ